MSASLPPLSCTTSMGSAAFSGESCKSVRFSDDVNDDVPSSALPLQSLAGASSMSDDIGNIGNLQRDSIREVTLEKEKSVAGIVDRALLEVIENAFDILSANVKSWPPLEGLSADEGESALKDLVMGQCEKVVISKSSSPAHDDELRMRAQQAIEERTRILRISVSSTKKKIQAAEESIEANDVK